MSTQIYLKRDREYVQVERIDTKFVPAVRTAFVVYYSVRVRTAPQSQSFSP